MEAELIQLAREAVAALQAGPPPNWTEIAAVGIGVGQILVILGGLWLMNKASNIRNRQLDIMEARQQAQSDALERQGEMMTQALQGLQQQGEVLAELLRRRE